MQLADALVLDAPRRTADGYLAVRAKAARTGVYDYLASEVGAPASFKPTDTVKVYRDEAEVFAADSVRSFIGRPITNDHPREGVTAANWRDHARGVNMGAMRDGDYLAFDLVLMDAATIADVDAGKRELSNGYSCQLDWTPGTAPDGTAYDARQHTIRGNHIAVVDRGRAGPDCAIKDGQKFGLCDAAPTDILDSMKEKPVKTMLIDGLTVDISNADTAQATIATILAARDGALAKVTDLETQIATLTTESATKDAKITTLEQQVKDAKPTAAQLRDAAKAYAIIADKAKALGVQFAEDADSDAIMAATVSAKMGDAAKDWSAEQIAASFAVLAKDVKAADPIADAFRGGIQSVGDAAAQTEAAYGKSVTDLNAWRAA